jgi:transforming growth factor-beta-induced protein
MKKFLAIALSLTFLFTINIQAAENDIVDIASSDSTFSTLVAALQEAELVGALQGEGPFTVFAPTNDAFAALLNQLGITAEELLAHPDLSDVLLYHVVSGKVMSTDLSDGLTANSLQGESIAFDLSDGVKVNSSTVITADIDATNGVIHVIDAVLVPESFTLSNTTEAKPSIVDIATGNSDFSMLVMLLQKADLVGALQGDGPFTVFAPTNAAFEDLLASLDITADELMAQPELAKVLLHHVVSGNIMSTDLSDGLTANSLQEETLTFDLSDGVMVDNARVTTADVEASNGVVHIIDAILIPDGFTLQSVSMDVEEVPYTGVASASLIPAFVLGGASLLGFVGWKRRNR